MRIVASVVSVSDKSKSLKLKSRRRKDWADGTVATFKPTYTYKHEEVQGGCGFNDMNINHMNIKVHRQHDTH